MKKINKIKLLFEESGGIMTTKTLVEEGVSHYYIKKMRSQKIIEPLKRGVYKLSAIELDESVALSKMIPKGVVCLFSAASIHELTTNIPFQYHVAIPKKSKVRLPKYPPVKLYYWDTALYTLGMETLQRDKHTISIYDKEKTVCDFLKFKNKLGFDTAKEVLKTYLNRKDRNIDKLSAYSKKLRIYSIIDPYLKILT